MWYPGSPPATTSVTQPPPPCLLPSRSLLRGWGAEVTYNLIVPTDVSQSPVPWRFNVDHVAKAACHLFTLATCEPSSILSLAAT